MVALGYSEAVSLKVAPLAALKALGRGAVSSVVADPIDSACVFCRAVGVFRVESIGLLSYLL